MGPPRWTLGGPLGTHGTPPEALGGPLGTHGPPPGTQGGKRKKEEVTTAKPVLFFNTFEPCMSLTFRVRKDTGAL